MRAHDRLRLIFIIMALSTSQAGFFYLQCEGLDIYSELATYIIVPYVCIRMYEKGIYRMRITKLPDCIFVSFWFCGSV